VPLKLREDYLRSIQCTPCSLPGLLPSPALQTDRDRLPKRGTRTSAVLATGSSVRQRPNCHVKTLVVRLRTVFWDFPAPTPLGGPVSAPLTADRPARGPSRIRRLLGTGPVLPPVPYVCCRDPCLSAASGVPAPYSSAFGGGFPFLSLPSSPLPVRPPLASSPRGCRSRAGAAPRRGRAPGFFHSPGRKRQKKKGGGCTAAGSSVS